MCPNETALSSGAGPVQLLELQVKGVELQIYGLLLDPRREAAGRGAPGQL